MNDRAGAATRAPGWRSAAVAEVVALTALAALGRLTGAAVRASSTACPAAAAEQPATALAAAAEQPATALATTAEQPATALATTEQAASALAASALAAPERAAPERAAPAAAAPPHQGHHEDDDDHEDDEGGGRRVRRREDARHCLDATAPAALSERGLARGSPGLHRGQPFFVSQKIFVISAMWSRRRWPTATSVVFLDSPAAFVACQKSWWSCGYFSRCSGLK